MSMPAKIAVGVALIVGLGCSAGEQRAGSGERPARSGEVRKGSGELRTGVFAGPAIGLKYETRSVSGVTNGKGEFQYREGEGVTFSVGELLLGTAAGAGRVTLVQLVPRVDHNEEKLRDPWVTNLARFLQTLDQDGNVENGVTIAPQAHAVIGRQPIHFNQTESAHAGGRGPRKGDFARDPAVTGLLAKLNGTPGVFTAGTPRQLRAEEAARNELRRNVRGIIKTTDVRIPLRDGAFVHADIFRPADEERHPVVMTLTVYGKAFERGCICNAKDAQEREEMEDRYFSDNPDGFAYESHEMPNTAAWVPKGYVLIRVDTRGTCNVPGTLNAYSYQESKDYYDAIEWAAAQPWSNGNVGLWGQSYTAWIQPNVMALQPPHLKATVQVGTDSNSYEDVMFAGGIENGFVITYLRTDKGVGKVARGVVCGENKFTDFGAIAEANPFNEPEIYGPQGEIFISPDMSKVTIPMSIVMPTTHRGRIHQLGSSNTFIRAATPLKDKKLEIELDWPPPSYTRAAVAKDMAFFDYWLKGVKNGIMDTPPVHILMRTGNGGYYAMDEQEWPIARTKYTKWYLDASPSTWAGDGRRKDFLRMSMTPPGAEKRTSYSAEVDAGAIYPDTPRGTPCWATGMSFVSDPLPEELVLAGYMKLGLWVSSTSRDMDIYAAMRVIDEQNREVNYSRPSEQDGGVPLNLPDDGGPWRGSNLFPVGWGALKVSHRKLDPKLSTEYWPNHTHRKADYAPLENDEVVPVEVGLWPSTAVVKKGHRIRLDVQPYGGCGNSRHYYDPSYHTGAQNSVYTGPKHQSYLQLPVIPPVHTVELTAAR